MSTYIDGPALAQVLLAALIAGVGLVSVFALGLRGMAAAEAGRPAGMVLAGASFLLVAAGLVLGLSFLLAK